MSDREAILDEVLAIEMAMFVAVNEQKASCQERPEDFLRHRRAQFAAWPAEVLTSWLDDLRVARADGENLMLLKYARMDGLVEPWTANPLLDEIVALVTAWQLEMFERYPALMGKARPLTPEDTDASVVSFAAYARAEYETCSDATIALLHAALRDKLERGVNMSEEVYAHLVRESGFGSLPDAERALAARATAAG